MDQGDGLMARLIDRTFENPATSGGLLVMALTAAAIVTNATMLQGARHPGPLFGSPVADAPAFPVLAPRVSEPVEAFAEPVANSLPFPATAAAAREMPIPRASPRRGMIASAAAPAPVSSGITDLLGPAETVANPPVPPEPVPVARSSEQTLLIEIQRELARVGLYSDAIDGMSGPRTTAAIRAFQTAAGMPANGTPSIELLGALRQPLPAQPLQPAGVQSDDALAEAAALNRRERERAELIAAEQQRHAESRQRENVRIVQTALNRIGYGPLPTEGVSDGETRDAIRRFELDNGLPITGDASDGLIERLVAIGAIKPG